MLDKMIGTAVKFNEYFFNTELVLRQFYEQLRWLLELIYFAWAIPPTKPTFPAHSETTVGGRDLELVAPRRTTVGKCTHHQRIMSEVWERLDLPK